MNQLTNEIVRKRQTDRKKEGKKQTKRRRYIDRNEERNK